MVTMMIGPPETVSRKRGMIKREAASLVIFVLFQDASTPATLSPIASEQRALCHEIEDSKAEKVQRARRLWPAIAATNATVGRLFSHPERDIPRRESIPSMTIKRGWEEYILKYWSIPRSTITRRNVEMR
jgi:hypothetical protein